jgi:hypothetical protein
MSAFLSIHDVKHLSALTVWTADNECSPHLTLDFSGDDFANHGGITFYINDAILNARLIEAINRVVAERKAELAPNEREAA